MREPLKPGQRLILVGAMALLCITAAIVYAVRDALKSRSCPDEDGDGECDDVGAGLNSDVSLPTLVVAHHRTLSADLPRLTVTAFLRSAPRADHVGAAT